MERFSPPANRSYGLSQPTPQIGYSDSSPAKQSVIPPVLYFPVREVPGEGLYAEVHDTTDGRRALLVFTALDRLLDTCGANQTWRLIETTALDAVQETQPFDIVAFDPELPAQLLADGRIR